MFSAVSGCGVTAQWLEHSCAKREAVGSIPSCAAWFFPFLRPSVSALFLRMVCWNGLIDLFREV